VYLTHSLIITDLLICVKNCSLFGTVLVMALMFSLCTVYLRCCATLGLGSGVSAALFADIARVTSSSERTAVMAIFMAVRQIGLLIGMFCSLTRNCSLHLN